jgi:hypothetical protein
MISRIEAATEYYDTATEDINVLRRIRSGKIHVHRSEAARDTMVFSRMVSLSDFISFWSHFPLTLRVMQTKPRLKSSGRSFQNRP